MINIFIKTILCLIVLYLFFYVFSFSMYEIKNNNNKPGGISAIIFDFFSAICSILTIIFA